MQTVKTDNILTENTDDILDIENLHIEFRTDEGTVKAVNGLNMVIGRGKILGLVGETGAGKTTTGLAILNLVPSPAGVVTGGRILLDGIDILPQKDKQMERIRGKIVSMIFQDPMTSLNPVQTVEQQIAEVIEHHERLGKANSLEKAREMLELVGIQKERGCEYPHQFSGGMKQRVVIAIALACNPKFLIADEPTTALDVTIQAQVLEMIKELRREFGMAMLMITHDLGIVADICDDVSIIYAGRIVEHGTLADVFDEPKHPYTIGLFGSLPDMENLDNRLKPIPGLMPDPTNLPPGCAFCPRCPHALGICNEQKPEAVYFNDTHFVECYLFTDGKTNSIEQIKD